jgi:hypothetical protein
MKYLLLALCTIPAFGAATNIKIGRVTHQQIIVSYDAPSGDDCTIELSESPTYTPLAYDVNGSLFSGAASDLLRPSTFVAGTRRVIVLGARATDKATDGSGKRYSRSLSQNTAYFGRLSNCGGSAATFTTVTPVQPYGPVMDTYQPHPDLGMEGHYNFPSMDIFDRSEIIIDQFTGQKLRKVQLPGDMTDANEATGISAQLGTPLGPGWTNPANVGTVADTAVASFSGTTQAVLFIPNAQFSDSVNRGFLWHLELDVTARITGSPTGEDAKLQVCMGTALTCDSPWQDFTVSTGATPVKSIVGDDEPASWFWTNGEYVPEQWWSSTAGIGYRIRAKTTNAAYQVEIDSVAQRFKLGVNYNSSSSQYHQFHPLTTVEPADGKTYRLAYFLDRAGAGNTALYAIATDATSHFMGPVHITTGNVIFVQLVFDRLDARTFYGLSTSGTIYKCVISSASGTLNTDVVGVDRDTGQSPKIAYTAITATGFSVDEQVAAFNPLYSTEFRAEAGGPIGWGMHMGQNGKMILKAQDGQDRGTWVAVFDPRAPKPAGCATCEGAVIAAAGFGAVGAGGPQCNKFCTVHAMSPGEQADWIHIGASRLKTTQDSTYFYGPWRIQVKKPACDIPTADCSITTAMTTFEIVPVGGTNYNFTDATPGATEDATIPLEVGDLLLFIKAGLTDLQWATGDEYMEVLSKDDTAHTITVRRGTNIMQSDWILGTAFLSESNNITNTAQAIPEGGFLYGICRFMPVNEDQLGDTAWNFIADPKGDKVVKPADSGVGAYSPTSGIRPKSDGYASPRVQHYMNSGNHGVWGKLPNSQAMYTDFNDVWCPAFYVSGDFCYNMQVGADNIDAINAPTVGRTVQVNGFFAGQDPTYAASYQSHLRQAQQFGDAQGRQLEWMGDVRPFVAPTGTVLLLNVSGNTWRVSGTTTLSRKHYPTMAYSGNRILKDISGPGSVIDDSKPWTYCVALKADECVTGSSVGYVYANSPLKNQTGCYTSTTSIWNIYPTINFGVCVEDTPAYVFGPVQIEISRSDLVGTNMRTLHTSPIRPGIQTQFAVPFATGDGYWLSALAESEGWSSFWIIYAADMPSPQQTLPNTFARVKVNLAHATADKFRVEFGYREEGAETAYQCTSRNDTCVIDSATVSDATPFKWASETTNYVSCSGGHCTAEIPRRPGRVVFSRALFYDASSNLIETRVLPPQ